MLSNSISSHLQAFAWWPELLAEHAEKFLSLYSVDMDSALEAQPQDSWDSFPLFQLLNNSLRNDSKIFFKFFFFCVHKTFPMSPHPRNLFLINMNLKIKVSVPMFIIYVSWCSFFWNLGIFSLSIHHLIPYSGNHSISQILLCFKLMMYK